MYASAAPARSPTTTAACTRIRLGRSSPLQTAALARHPTYDRVRLALWDVYAEQGDHERALAAVQPVPAASAWARPARFLAGLSQLNLKKLDDAFGTYKATAS